MRNSKAAKLFLSNQKLIQQALCIITKEIGLPIDVYGSQLHSDILKYSENGLFNAFIFDIIVLEDPEYKNNPSWGTNVQRWTIAFIDNEVIAESINKLEDDE